MSGSIIQDYYNEVQYLRDQRDELVAALELIAEIAETRVDGNSPWGAVYRSASAALAKVNK